tara:strand:+ start:4088 stop:4975 length:888 start_codon:yes stop_codon:yes gene_type:complete
MNKILLILIILVSFSFSEKKIKTKIEYHSLPDGEYKIISTFNPSGNIVKSIFYNSENNIDSTKYWYYHNFPLENFYSNFPYGWDINNGPSEHFSYTSSGLISKETTYNSKNELIKQFVYNYDSNNNITKIYRSRRKLFRDGELSPPITFNIRKINYDENNNKIEEFIDNELRNELVLGRHLPSRIKFEYDKKNKKIEEKLYDDKSNIIIIKNYKYDSNSNMIESSKNRPYDFKDKINSKFKYDSNNNLIEKIVTGDYGFNIKTIFNYDSLNNIESEFIIEHGQPKSIYYKYEYYE